MTEQELVKRLADPTRALYSLPNNGDWQVPQDVQDAANNLYRQTAEACKKARNQRLFFRLLTDQDNAIWQETRKEP